MRLFEVIFKLFTVKAMLGFAYYTDTHLMAGFAGELFAVSQLYQLFYLSRWQIVIYSCIHLTYL